MRKKLDLMYSATGVSEANLKRPMFMDMVQAGSLIAMYGMNPSDAFDYSTFKQDASFKSQSMCALADALGFDFYRVGEDGYTGPALMQAMDTCSDLSSNVGQTGTAEDKFKFDIAPLLLAVCTVRYIYDKHPSYKSDYLKITAALPSAFRR